MSKSVNSIKMKFLFYCDAELPQKSIGNELILTKRTHNTHTHINTDGAFILFLFFIVLSIKSD